MTYRPALPKPEPRRKVKARAARHERAVVKRVRAVVAARDGYCRLKDGPFGPCRGASEWNHLEKRSLTSRRAAERRHRTENTAMFCSDHHRQIDEHTIRVTALTIFGADGPLRFKRFDFSWSE